ncbi:MAG: hydroxyacylglutathione hydrolase family protein [Candidatus Electryonea clarkiae]|nr:hydroxyacylglutathione hydrolase family protein [Candidatus Electryonea clarkiae]MDP8287283.1 hydroxyacylglutathione hydrolase family protein [Candidatus Electryonea clarkiae]
MLVKQFMMGGDRNFGYLVADEESRKAMVIDPSYTPEQIIEYAKQHNYIIQYVLNTHDHHDHSNGNAEMERATGIPALTYGDIDKSSGNKIDDNAVIQLGEISIRIIHTPGHTLDSICILAGDALFTGDTLFVGKVGGTGLGDDARMEYESLHNKLMMLPDETRVFPGHDVGVAPESTIGHERRTNPFLLQPDYESFLHLKKTWLEYKKIHGID